MITKTQVIILSAIVSLGGLILGAVADGFLADRESRIADHLNSLYRLHDERGKDLSIWITYEAVVIANPLPDGHPPTEREILVLAQASYEAATYSVWSACGEDTPPATSENDGQFCPRAPSGTRLASLEQQAANSARYPQRKAAVDELTVIDGQASEAYEVFRKNVDDEIAGAQSQEAQISTLRSRVSGLTYTVALLGVVLSTLKDLIPDQTQRESKTALQMPNDSDYRVDRVADEASCDAAHPSKANATA